MLRSRIWQRRALISSRTVFSASASSHCSSSSSPTLPFRFVKPNAPSSHVTFYFPRVNRCWFSTQPALDLPASKLVDVPLAQTGEGIAECELLRWYVQEGDYVEDFQPLCEVQSDKATIEITSRYKGKVSNILYGPGDIVKVGETLLKILVDDSALPSVTLGDSETAKSPDSDKTLVNVPVFTTVVDDLDNAKLIDSDPGKGRQTGILSTPAVRSLAKQHGIDITEVCGTGKDGRVLKEDVLNFAVSKGIIKDPSALLHTDSVEQLQGAEGYNYNIATKSYSPTEDRTVSFRGFQRAMVKSMSLAAKVPHFHYVDEINCDALVELKTSFQKNNPYPDIKYTFLPILIKSLSMALSKYPFMNSCFKEDALEVVLKGSHNVGIAMATQHGLVVPNIKNVQSLSILEITKELARLQQLASNNKLTSEDISGGTITLSNIGAIGGKFGSPLVNLPEVSIIAIGKIQKVPRFASDTYLNRFTTCLLFGSLEVLALAMLTVQAASNHLHPEACGKSSCVKGGIAGMFYTSLCLMALGMGGVRGSMTAFGADQFDEKDPTEAKALASFFNWLLMSSTVGAITGVTGVVWVSTQKAWHWGFFIITIASSVGFVTLALGKPFYRIKTPGDSPTLRIAQVIVVAFKNRKLSLPESHGELYEISDKDATAEKIAHTSQMRILDKAAIIQENSKPQAWKVCTVTQVEEVKILTRMLPIVASTIILNTCMAQLQTFSVQQGNIMNLKLGSLTVPAPSIPVIPLVFISVLVPLYELFFVPFARKITQHPSGITQLQRVGVGLVLSAISMAVAGIVEVKRRDQGRKDPSKPISLFWLSFQYGIFGIADMFTLVGLLEFFYRESPASMKSLSTSLTWLSTSLGYFLSTVFVNVINAVTQRITPSKQGWLHGFDLNQNNLNLFYWFLATLSCLNFFNYLYWASRYKYKREDSGPGFKGLGEMPLNG